MHFEATEANHYFLCHGDDLISFQEGCYADHFASVLIQYFFYSTEIL